MSSIFQSCFLCFTHIPNLKDTNQKVSYGCASVWFGTANNRQTVLGVLPAFSGQSEQTGLLSCSRLCTEKSSGESTHPWGAPVLTVRVLDIISPSLTCCFLSIRKFVIHWQVEAGSELGEFGEEDFWDDGVKHRAEVYKQHPCICPLGVEVLQDVVQSHVDCIIH